MSSAGEQRIDSILESLVCPECQYSLRGLTGEVITCPECGKLVNVQRYVAAQWHGRWFHAPLYNTLALPAAWVMIVLIATLIVASTIGDDETGPFILLGGVTLAFIGWTVVLVVVTRRFGSLEGLWLALLVHLTVPGYLIGVIMTIGGVVATVMSIGYSNGSSLDAITSVMVALGGVLLIVVAVVIERFVAHRCIRRHLRMAANVQV